MTEQSHPAPIRIVLVEDHTMVAESLGRALDAMDGLVVVAMVGTCAEAMPAIEASNADVALIDPGMPDGDGVDVVAAVTARRITTKVIVLSGAGDDRTVRRAIEAGAVGYLRKDAPLDQLASAIRRAHAGELVLAATDIAAVLAGHEAADAAARFTSRQREILELMATGLSNKVIAERLFISVDTVRTHVQHILAKLGAHSRLEAVANARAAGLLP